MNRVTMMTGLALLFGGMGQVRAGMILQTLGSGSAVTSVDRQATFDNVQTGTNLNGYTEDKLLISVGDSAFTAFDPTNGSGLGGFSGGFFYPNSGVNGGTLIATTDGAEVSGIEFNVGNGDGDPTTHFAWEGFKNGTPEGAGAFDVTSGSVLGFSDPSGFDTLYIGAYNSLTAAQSANVVTDFQAAAIDNVKVQLQNSSTAPEPSTLTILGMGAGGLIGYGWRRRKLAVA